MGRGRSAHRCAVGGAGTRHNQMHDAEMYIDVNREKGVSNGTVTV
jgi:hypothetical protein